MALRDAGKWFGKRQVSTEECLRCTLREPERPSQPDFKVDHVERPIGELGPPPEASGPPPKPPLIQGDGTIVYQKSGWEPPSVPPGYRRKTDDLKHPDAWVMVLETPLCKHCVLKQTKREACNCIRVVPTCTYRGKSKKINLDECSKCPNKK
jgi:hypothetical protein